MVTLRGSLNQDLLGFESCDIPSLWVFRWSCHFTSNLGLGYLHFFAPGQPVMIRGGGGDCWSCDNDYSYSDYVVMTTDRRTRR